MICLFFCEGVMIVQTFVKMGQLEVLGSGFIVD